MDRAGRGRRTRDEQIGRSGECPKRKKRKKKKPLSAQKRPPPLDCASNTTSSGLGLEKRSRPSGGKYGRCEVWVVAQLRKLEAASIPERPLPDGDIKGEVDEEMTCAKAEGSLRSRSDGDALQRSSRGRCGGNIGMGIEAEGDARADVFPLNGTPANADPRDSPSSSTSWPWLGSIARRLNGGTGADESSDNVRERNVSLPADSRRKASPELRCAACAPPC